MVFHVKINTCDSDRNSVVVFGTYKFIPKDFVWIYVCSQWPWHLVLWLCIRCASWIVSSIRCMNRMPGALGIRFGSWLGLPACKRRVTPRKEPPETGSGDTESTPDPLPPRGPASARANLSSTAGVWVRTSLQGTLLPYLQFLLHLHLCSIPYPCLVK